MIRKPVESLSRQIALARKSLAEWPTWLREASGMKALTKGEVQQERHAGLRAELIDRVERTSVADLPTLYYAAVSMDNVVCIERKRGSSQRIRNGVRPLTEREARAAVLDAIDKARSPERLGALHEKVTLAFGGAVFEYDGGPQR